MVSSKKIKYRIFCIKRDIGVMSIAEVAEACGISVSRIEMIEDGRSFSLKHLLMLASVYGVRVKILIK